MLLVGSAVQFGDHKGRDVAASCVGHFGLARPSAWQAVVGQRARY
jgi:hypothetical protein